MLIKIVSNSAVISPYSAKNFFNRAEPFSFGAIRFHFGAIRFRFGAISCRFATRRFRRWRQITQIFFVCFDRLSIYFDGLSINFYRLSINFGRLSISFDAIRFLCVRRAVWHGSDAPWWQIMCFSLTVLQSVCKKKCNFVASFIWRFHYFTIYGRWDRS